MRKGEKFLTSLQTDLLDSKLETILEMVGDKKIDFKDVISILDDIILKHQQPEDLTTRKIFERENILYVSVTADGSTSEEWKTRLTNKGITLGKFSSYNLFPTRKTYKLAIIKPECVKKFRRTTLNVREFARDLGFLPATDEIAFLLREKISDEELAANNLWGIIFPNEDRGGSYARLYANRYGAGNNLGPINCRPGYQWGDALGFCFVVPD